MLALAALDGPWLETLEEAGRTLGTARLVRLLTSDANEAPLTAAGCGRLCSFLRSPSLGPRTGAGSSCSTSWCTSCVVPSAGPDRGATGRAGRQTGRRGRGSTRDAAVALRPPPGGDRRGAARQSGGLRERLAHGRAQPASKESRHDPRCQPFLRPRTRRWLCTGNRSDLPASYGIACSEA